MVNGEFDHRPGEHHIHPASSKVIHQQLSVWKEVACLNDINYSLLS